LPDQVIRKIIALKLVKVAQRVQEHYKAAFTYTPDLVDTIAARCTEVDTGARNVDHILNRTLLPELSAEILAGLALGRTISAVAVAADDTGKFRYALS
jgi:type VI secretion system protein VasG